MVAVLPWDLALLRAGDEGSRGVAILSLLVIQGVFPWKGSKFAVSVGGVGL